MSGQAPVVDCFLYSDQSPYRELLKLRVALLRDVVDRFVVVCSRQTFSGVMLPTAFPEHDPFIQKNRDRIHLVLVEELHSVTPRKREEVSRNAIARGLFGLPRDALIMISDIDELPRPEIVADIVRGPTPTSAVVLGLEYFNFKFNYRLVHGVQQLWAGPVVTPLSLLGAPHDLRHSRWSLYHDPERVVHDAGWHFSFLTTTDDVRPKLDTMFVRGEVEWRGFRDGIRSDRHDSVSELISVRRGFHDHMYGGCVWAKVPISDLHCTALERLVEELPNYVLPGPADPPLDVRRKESLAMWRLYEDEIPKILNNATWQQIASEVAARSVTRMRRSILRFQVRPLRTWNGGLAEPSVRRLRFFGRIHGRTMH